MCFKGNLLHIHGSLAPNDDIVFGVEDSAKLPKEHVFLYKAHSPHLKVQEFSDWLNSAERIIFYGYSLGDTDHQYFEKFLESYVLMIGHIPNWYSTIMINHLMIT